MNTELRDRLLTAADNLKAARGIRPRDLFNFASMIWSLPKPSAGHKLPITPAQVALTMFTRMQLSYEPGDTPAMDAPPSAAPDFADFAEPTVALFVDAPEHLSGVSLTLEGWSEQARAQGKPFFLHMAGSEVRKPGCKSFPKVGTFRLSTYDGLEIPVPDVKAVTDYMKEHPFDVAHLSTPGPMGLLGMRIARDRGAPVCGTYHTNFPRYVRDLTGSADLEEVTWAFMRWFYGQMDLVAVPSRATGDDLIAHGLAPERLHVVGRGVEQSVFSPEHRSEALRASWGVQPGETVLLYVGRVSREKNLPLLTETFRQLGDLPARLVIVGDGPYLPEMREALAGTRAVFTGALRGDELSAAFASGDLFVFPSVTDTFGRVIIEAQASGLPVLVSDQGGPQDAILPEETGIIVPDITADRYAAALRELLRTPGWIAEASPRAREHARSFTPEASFNQFWNLHRTALKLQEKLNHG